MTAPLRNRLVPMMRDQLCREPARSSAAAGNQPLCCSMAKLPRCRFNMDAFNDVAWVGDGTGRPELFARRRGSEHGGASSDGAVSPWSGQDGMS